MPDNKPSILIFDLECSDLRADWGVTLCIGYKWIGDKKPKILSIDDYEGWKDDLTDDSKLISDFHKIMSQADMYITYYGKGFDVKWLFSKFLKHGLPVLPNTPHVDLYFVARSNLNLSRKSLDNLSKYLSLPNKKFYVNGDDWQKARVGNADAISKIKKHCYADVVITEQLYYRLRPLVRTHPRVGDYLACRHCGSSKVQRRGYALTSTKGRQIRIQCQNCTAWDTRQETEVMP